MASIGPLDIDLSKLVIIGDYLAYDTGEHNCVGSDEASSGMHEPYCGCEPICPLEHMWNALKSNGVVSDKPALPQLVKRDTVMRRNWKYDGHLIYWESVQLDTHEVDLSFENEVRPLCS